MSSPMATPAWEPLRRTLAREIAQVRRDMREAARALEFERAAELRDRVRELEALLLGVQPPEVDAG